MKMILQKGGRNSQRLSGKRLLAALTIGTLGAGGLFSVGVSAESPQLPEAEGKTAVLESCTGCHDVELVTAQRKSPDEWEATVNRMIANGATLDETQYDQIVAYLRKNLTTQAASQSKPG